jgi:thiamine transporter ThiT
MRTHAAHFLQIALFLGVAVVIDFLSVTAIGEVGSDGVSGVLLTIICLVVGTVSTFVFIQPLLRRLAPCARPPPPAGPR